MEVGSQCVFRSGPESAPSGWAGEGFECGEGGGTEAARRPPRRGAPARSACAFGFRLRGCAGKAGLGFDRSAACPTSSSAPGSRNERGPEGPPRDRCGAAEPVGGTARLPPDGPRLALPAPASRSHAALPCRRCSWNAACASGAPRRSSLSPPPSALRLSLRPQPLRGPVPRFRCQRLVWSWTGVFKNEADGSPREQAL